MNAFVPLLITLLIQSFSVLSMILPVFSGLHELPIMRTSCLAAGPSLVQRDMSLNGWRISNQE